MGAVDDIALQAVLNPGRLALSDLESGRSWSYHELDLDVARCAEVLHARGCREGDRVATLCRNHALLPILHHACARIGAVYVPLSFRLGRAELQDRLDDVAPSLVVHDEPPSASRGAELRLAQLDDAMADARIRRGPAIVPDRPSLLLFTSGSTGRPKGALLTERNLRETAVNFTQLGRVDRGSRFLCDAPMFHVIGLVSNVRPAFMHGGAVLVSRGFDPETTLTRLSDATLDVSHYFCVPQMLAALRTHPGYRPARLSRRLVVFTGGAPHPAASVRAALEEGLLVVDGYGMTEVGAVFGMPLDREIIARKAGSVGVATPRVQTRIVDEAGEPCPPGVPGELLVRGDTVSPGYLRRRTSRDSAPDGWFRTGDVFVVDSDGFHTVVDRKKDMFISGGENVYPAEVEAQLSDFPGVAEVAVVGVPDSRWGEVGHLAFVASAGAAPEPAALLAHLQGRVARYKIPAHVTRLEALPRTPSGKLLKARLRALLQASTEGAED